MRAIDVEAVLWAPMHNYSGTYLVVWLYKLLARLANGLKSVALAAVLQFEEDEVRVIFTFHRPTIEALKALRVGARWDKEGSFWAAPAGAGSQIARMLDGLGYTWVVTGEDTGPSWSDSLFERAPSHLRPSLFRALAQVVHPDHNGDAAMMRELSESWQAVSRATA